MAESRSGGHRLLILLFLITTFFTLCTGCIQLLPGCRCSMVGSAKRPRGRKVDCSKLPTPIKSLSNKKFPPDIVHLNLARNALVILRQGSFIQYSRLQKLDLSRNQIAAIEAGAFDGLLSLKKLDLSHNAISTINSSMFSGLRNLEKLILSNNKIVTIPDGSFNDLTSLKRIELKSENLHCDCKLKWILDWTATRHVRIPSSTMCGSPSKMKGSSLAKLNHKDLRCENTPQVPNFDIQPSESQLVFKGDKLPFQCRATYMGEMSIAWLREGHVVTTNKSLGVVVNTSHTLDRMQNVVNHWVVVESLDASHSGDWSCMVSTASGNHSKTVRVEVRVPESSLLCPMVSNKTSRGVYIWEETMAGLLVSQPCIKQNDPGDLATHQCGIDGQWHNLNISACSYLKEITRKMSRFAKVKATSDAIPTLMFGVRKALLAAERDKELMDSFTVDLTAQVMARLLPYSAETPKICRLMVDMASNASTTTPSVLKSAQMESKAPLRMAGMLEQMSKALDLEHIGQEWSYYGPNIAVMVPEQTMARQTGISCLVVPQGDQDSTGVPAVFSSSNFFCSQLDLDQHALIHIRLPGEAALKPPTTTIAPPPPPPTTTTTVTTTEKIQLDLENTDSVNQSEESLANAGADFNSSSFGNDTSLVDYDSIALSSRKLLALDFDSPAFTSDKSSEDYSFSGGKDNVFPSFPLSKDQLKRLNISTKFFSGSTNLTSKDLFKASPHLFPFAKSFVNAYTTAPVPVRTNVFVIVYRNGHLFPVLQSSLADPQFQKGEWVIITPVVAVSIGASVHKLSEPVEIVFEVADLRRPVKPAYFDFEAIDGYGGWRTEGCNVVRRNGSHFTVHAYHLGHFALLQDLSVIYRQAAFPMEIVIYVGSGLCMLCMIIVISTLICCFSTIGIPKKVKHAVSNICISTLLLMAAFALGINRTDMELPCQIAGIAIHYLTLCAVFWITITSNIIYKKFIKANRPPEPPPEPIVMPLPPKPILQFYFVGYGVPLIICGITAAVNLNFYAGLQYCFLEWEPSLGAFYAPVALLVAWNLILFLRISCVVRSVPENDSEMANDSDNEIHTNEIELIPSQPDTTTTTHNINSNNLNGGSSYRRRYSRASTDDEEDLVSVVSLPDQERRPITQLRSLVAILFLFIVMWMCGALAIAEPFHLIIPYQKLIFSYIYGLMSALFGIFMITFFCFTRKDSRMSWKRAAGCAPPEPLPAPMEVVEPQTELEQPQPQPQANGTAIKSNSNTNLSVYSQKSSNITKAYNMKNNSNIQSNINLMMPNSSEISFGSTQEGHPNFYNPRQNGAAKKFWQKNRQHSKIMNKDVNRDLNSSLTDNNSANELSPRLSQGASSDANTHFSIEIQIQAKDRHNSNKSGFSGSREIPVHMSNPQQNMLGSSCGAISIEHNHMVGTSPEPAHRESSLSPNNLQITSQGSNPSLQQPQHSPSTGSLGKGGPSAFTPVQPRSGTSAQNSPQGGGEGEELAERGQSAEREALLGPRTHMDGPLNQLCELTNQGNSVEFSPQINSNPGITWNPYPCNLPPLPSQHKPYSFNPPPPAHSHQQHYPFDFSTAYAPPPAPPVAQHINPHMFNLNQSRSPLPHNMSPTPFGPTMTHPQLPPFNIPPSPYLAQTQGRGPMKSMSPASSSSHQSQSHSGHKRRSSGHSNRPLSGGDSSDSSRPRQKRANSGGSPGRTVHQASRSPVMSDSQAYESRYQSNQSSHRNAKPARSVDSDHHSDPTHRKKHQKSDRRSRNNKLSTKQRSLGWEEQFKNRTPKVNYVYVNHMYRDKVMHKLIKQASESDDLATKAFWLPRSASEYERLTQKGFCNMADDTSSSSDDDSFDNVWIRQSSGSDFQKKETSV